MFIFNTRDSQILHDNPAASSNDWEKSVYKKVKENLKKYYCITQRRKCVYCRTELASHCHSEHIEHVVNKALKPQWMFEPFNLGISCTQCNTQKGEAETLRNHINVFNVIVLPQGSMHYQIVHPQFDRYEDHLEIEDDFFIKAKTKGKGEKTIDMCKLWRPLYADKRAMAKGLSDADRYTIWLARISKPGISEEKDAFLEEVDWLLQVLSA